MLKILLMFFVFVGLVGCDMPKSELQKEIDREWSNLPFYVQHELSHEKMFGETIFFEGTGGVIEKDIFQDLLWEGATSSFTKTNATYILRATSVRSVELVDRNGRIVCWGGHYAWYIGEYNTFHPRECAKTIEASRRADILEKYKKEHPAVTLREGMRKR